MGILCLPEYGSCEKADLKEWKKPFSFVLGRTEVLVYLHVHVQLCICTIFIAYYQVLRSLRGPKSQPSQVSSAMYIRNIIFMCWCAVICAPLKILFRAPLTSTSCVHTCTYCTHMYMYIHECLL